MNSFTNLINFLYTVKKQYYLLDQFLFLSFSEICKKYEQEFIQRV